MPSAAALVDRDSSIASRTPINSPPRRLQPCLLAAVLLSLSAPAPADQDANQPVSRPAEPHLQVLAEQAVAPTVQGIVEYMRKIHADNTNNELVRNLIRQLGDDSFTERDRATKALMSMAVLPEAALRQAAESEDAEVRARAEHILREADNRTCVLTLRAAMRTIQRKGLKGAAPAILRLVPLFPDLYVQRHFHDGLRATSRKADADLFRRTMRGSDPDLRIAAVVGLASIPGENHRADLHDAAVKDKHDRVRLAAAHELANVGDRRCLEALQALLSSEDAGVRARSCALLRALTGRRFDFVAYDKDETRSKAVEAWTGWLAGEGKTAKLSFPPRVKPAETGRTLMCGFGTHVVREIDASGKETFRISIRGPWGCQGLPNGHRLVASHLSRSVHEYDESGKEVWKKDKLPGGAMSVQRLENGNTLVACSDSHCILEITRGGKIAWQVTIQGRPVDARRLDNGRTLVALQLANRVVEVNREGKVVWKLENVFTPQTAQRLDGGNTLVAETSKNVVNEYDAGGRVVWSKGGFTSPYDTQRLSNGNTLVVDSIGVHEVSPNGKIINTIKQPRLGRARRY